MLRAGKVIFRSASLYRISAPALNSDVTDLVPTPAVVRCARARCEAPAIEGQQCCAVHAQANRERTRAAYHRLRAQGLCVTCWRRPVGLGRCMCLCCAAAAWRRQRVLRGRRAAASSSKECT